MTAPEIVQLVVQGGALGLLALVLWKVVLPLVGAVQALQVETSKQNVLLQQLCDDVYNGRCRYGAPSAGSYRAVRIAEKTKAP